MIDLTEEDKQKNSDVMDGTFEFKRKTHWLVSGRWEQDWNHFPMFTDVVFCSFNELKEKYLQNGIIDVYYSELVKHRKLV